MDVVQCLWDALVNLCSFLSDRELTILFMINLFAVERKVRIKSFSNYHSMLQKPPQLRFDIHLFEAVAVGIYIQLIIDLPKTIVNKKRHIPRQVISLFGCHSKLILVCWFAILLERFCKWVILHAWFYILYDEVTDAGIDHPSLFISTSDNYLLIAEMGRKIICWGYQFFGDGWCGCPRIFFFFARECFFSSSH